MRLTINKSLQEWLPLLSLQSQLQAGLYASDRRMAQSIGSQTLIQEQTQSWMQLTPRDKTKVSSVFSVSVAVI